MLLLSNALTSRKLDARHQGSHSNSSILGVACTHFRSTNKQNVLTTRGESEYTHFAECLVIFPSTLISKNGIPPPKWDHFHQWRAPPLLQLRRAAQQTPRRPMLGVSLRRWARLSPAVDGMERRPVRARAGRPSRRTRGARESHMPCRCAVNAPPPRHPCRLQRRCRLQIPHEPVRRARRARAAADEDHGEHQLRGLRRR